MVFLRDTLHVLEPFLREEVALIRVCVFTHDYKINLISGTQTSIDKVQGQGGSWCACKAGIGPKISVLCSKNKELWSD
jgi:hypothetical protein